MDCLICNTFNIKLEYCNDCLQPICNLCHSKLVSCPFCRKRFNSYRHSDLTLKLISKIENKTIKTDDPIYIKVFFNLVKADLKELAILYAKRSTNKYIYNHLALELWKENRTQEAIENFKKGTREDCDDCKINLAKIYLKKEFFNLKESEKLVDTIKDRIRLINQINYCRGIFCYHNKDYENTKKYLILSNLDCENKYHVLATIYREEKQYQRAYEIIQKTNNEKLILEFSPDKRVKRLLYDQDQINSNKKIKLICDILDQ